MSDEDLTAEGYNYSLFAGQGEFEDFPTVLRVGENAPDFTAALLASGESVRLSDYWRKSDIVVEFGSFT